MPIRTPIPRRPPFPVGGHMLTRLLALLLIGGVAAFPTLAPAATPPQAGTLAVEARHGDGSQDGATDAFRDAAAGALAARGFTLLDGAAHAAYWMELVIGTSDVGTGDAKVAPSRPDLMTGGVAGAVGSVFKAPLPSGKNRHVALQKTRLDMILRQRGVDAPVWRGSAVTVRSADRQGEAAAALCDALIRAYPFQSEDVIGVP